MVGQKFAVVDFFERSEVEIVETRHFLTKMDPSTFCGDKWSPNTQIHVMWPVSLKKSSGRSQQKHVARVLRFGDDKASLLPYLKAAENGKEVSLTETIEYGRGKRVREAKPSWSGSESEEETDDQLSDRQQNKKKKQIRMAVNEDARAELRRKLDDESTNSHELETTDEMTALHDEVLRLREENAALRNSFRIMKELPELLSQLKNVKQNIQHRTSQQAGPSRSNQAPAGPIDQCLSPPRIWPHPSPASAAPHSDKGLPLPQRSTPIQGQRALPLPVTPRNSPSHSQHVAPLLQNQRNSPSHSQHVAPLLQNQRNSPSHSQHVVPHLAQRVFNYDVNEDGQVDLGFGVFVAAQNLQFVSKADVKKTTYTICETLFSREELAGSSLTGRKSNAFKDLTEKPMLDKEKILAIIQFVQKLHPGSTEKIIRKIIAAKMNICQKLERSKKAS